MKFFTAVGVAGYTLAALAGAAPHNHYHKGKGKGWGSSKSSTKSIKPPLSTGSASSLANIATPFGDTTAPFANAAFADNDAPTLRKGTCLGNRTVVTKTVTVTPTPFPSKGSLRNSSKSASIAASNAKGSIPSKDIQKAFYPSSRPWGSPRTTFSIPTQSSAGTLAPPSSPAPYSSPAPSPSPAPSSSQAPSPSSTPSPSSAPPAGGGKVKFGGINMAGFDFGCTTDGTCTTGGNVDIVTNGNAVQQMQHFVGNGGLNAFRLPVGWQFLVNNQLGGSLDATNAGAYDKLVQGCLSSGAEMCIVDVHNYARYNGKIIGQGGPTNDQYASLWSQLATKYAAESKVAFDVMNEPHDLDVPTWAVSVQAAVTAIRQAGATSQTILLPGTDFASAASFVTSGSAQALSSVKNPDGSTTGLVFNVHKYLDSDGSGTHPSCVTNNIADAFAPLAQYLRQNKRMVMLTETGGGPNDASCLQMLCQQMDFINSNSDVFLGVITWAGGGFDQSYPLTQTPMVNGNTLTDHPLVTQCVVNKFGSGSSNAPPYTPPS